MAAFSEKFQRLQLSGGFTLLSTVCCNAPHEMISRFEDALFWAAFYCSVSTV
jgi:hypothetical protein